MTFTERRAFPRANIDCRVNIFLGLRIMAFNSATVNVSAGGIRIVLEEKLDASAPVRLQLSPLHEMVPIKSMPIECSAEAVWSAQKEGEPKGQRSFDTGFKFTEIDADDKDRLRSAVYVFLLAVQSA